MTADPRQFRQAAAAALDNATLQESLGILDEKFIKKRRAAVEALPEFEALRDRGVAIKDHTLAHLDLYLERFADRVEATGGQVHWAADAAAARRAVLDICRAEGVRSAVKSKSMIGEEIAINTALEDAGITPVETDLGEYILQLNNERPSHIIAPAVHKRKAEVAALFLKHHGGDAPLTRGEDMVAEARRILRKRYFAADAGITGANALVAETGQCLLVTNEGNGDLSQTLPRVHIVIASIDKVAPTLEDAGVILRLLARSATGQEMTSYTTFSAGPRRMGESVGPEVFHVVLLDNGRSALLEKPETAALLRCIKCGACMNHCPVYAAVGGHAWGTVYPGPLGGAINPALLGLSAAYHHPQASTLCGACEEVCPMRIPLPQIFRHWRSEMNRARVTPAPERIGVRLWSMLAAHPRLYRLALRAGRAALRLGAGRLIGGWSRRRAMPRPMPGSIFRDRRDRRR